MKKILLVTGILAFLLLSCPGEDEEDGEQFEGGSEKFWAADLTKKDEYYQINAKLLRGTYCDVWVEEGCGVSAQTARTVANVYDNEIYQKMIDTFSLLDFNYYYEVDGEDGEVEVEVERFSNVMELAGALVGGDGKLCILILDIKDSFGINGYQGYTEGYFWPGNFFEMKGSNGRSMIYIDANPGKPGEKSSNMTLAHEMQHLMNFVTSFVQRPAPGSLLPYDMDVWIDEGLASAAEWVCGGHLQNRINWYNTNGGKDKDGNKRGAIDMGNNFFVWDNRTSNPYAIQDDYATVYLFFQWLRLQAGDKSVYKDIICSEYYDWIAVVDAMLEPTDYYYDDWEPLLGDWLAANYINASSGRYGYKGEIQITASLIPNGTASLSLYPGEGVYSTTNSQPTLTGQGASIKNVYLNKNGQVNNSTFYSGGALLTYNKNDNIEGSLEVGKTTGVGASSSTLTSRSVSIAKGDDEFSGPFRVDARDMLRRNGHRGTMFEKRLVKHE
jgi:hypothetical protein